MTARYYVTSYDPKAYLIEHQGSPANEIVLRINFGQFVKELKTRKEVEVSPSHTWQIVYQNRSGVAGSFQGDNNQMLALELGHGFLEFIVWYRSFIPEDHDLYLFAEGEWDSLKLTTSITEKEIHEFTGVDL